MFTHGCEIHCLVSLSFGEVTLEQLPVPGGADRKDGEGLFTRGWSARTRGNGSKLTEGRFR